MDNLTIHSAAKVEYLIVPILSLPFCSLTLFVLAYYIRRRYKLYQEIKRIPQELLHKESYKNHLKNLKLKCIIHNFIIVILMLEFVRGLGYIICFLPDWFIDFAHESTDMLNFQLNIHKYSYLLLHPLAYSFVPLLSLLMNFLWLAYRKYEYKYTIIRWTWYIVIRAFLVLLYGCIYKIISGEFQILITIIYSLFIGSLIILDFIQYVYYSRRFYLHLKSRETEIRLFYFDNRAYLDIKYLRFHFKIATILVGIALFFLTVALSIDLIVRIFNYSLCSLTLLHRFCIQKQVDLFSTYVIFLASYPSAFICRIIFIFNYLYMFFIVVYKSYRDRQKLANINDYIKPIVKQYHDRYYSRYANYA